MRKLLLVAIAFAVSGCAQWNKLSEGEKTGIIIGTTVIVGAILIKNSVSNDINKICISTRSIKTGCGEATL